MFSDKKENKLISLKHIWWMKPYFTISQKQRSMVFFSTTKEISSFLTVAYVIHSWISRRNKSWDRWKTKEEKERKRGRANERKRKRETEREKLQEKKENWKLLWDFSFPSIFNLIFLLYLEPIWFPRGFRMFFFLFFFVGVKLKLNMWMI